MAFKKILTVSNAPVMQRFLQFSLTERGYQVTSAPNDRVILGDKLHKEVPDMVILDVAMPTLEGIELCLFIRHQFDIPILVLNAGESSTNGFRSFDLYSSAQCSKPYGILELVKRIDTVLSSNA